LSLLSEEVADVFISRGWTLLVAMWIH
jgi:hypothetical protein